MKLPNNRGRNFKSAKSNNGYIFEFDSTDLHYDMDGCTQYGSFKVRYPEVLCWVPRYNPNLEPKGLPTVLNPFSFRPH